MNKEATYKFIRKVMMKGVLLTFHFSLFTSALALTGCSDFLKEEDKDQVIPRTIEQYQAMLHQHGFLNVTWFYKSDLMTDDISENASATTMAKNPYKSLYTWQRDVERDGSGERTGQTNIMWEQLYNTVLVANYIIERAEEAEGTQTQRDNLIGEAHFLRARAYLELANIYAPVYDAATAKKQMGVPLRLGTGVQNDYERASLQEVYDLIESDLRKSISHFEAAAHVDATTLSRATVPAPSPIATRATVPSDFSEGPYSLWHPNKKAALLLLSRTYLYKGEWQKVIDTASELINLCPQGLYNLKAQPNSASITKSNPELLHTYGSCAQLITTDFEGVQQNEVPTLYKDENSMLAVYGISKDLQNAFHEGDCRPYTYTFATSSGIDVPGKWHTQFTKLGAYSYRLSEAYLSRAEAYAALGETDKALADVKALILTRVQDINKVNFPSPAAPEGYALALRRFILDERRLEFCGENHRWFDLRRSTSWYPQPITHVFTLSSSSSSGSTGAEQGKETYTLSPTSPNYVFELPEAETQINASIAPYGLRQDISPE